MIFTILLTIAAAIQILGGLAVVFLIGKPRTPMTPGAAIINMIIAFSNAALFLVLALR